jgi:hypothetical protein
VIGITPIFIVTEISLQIAAGYSHERTSLQIMYRHPCLIDRSIDLGAQSSRRPADGVIQPCGDLTAKVSNMRSQMPFLAQRLKRL